MVLSVPTIMICVAITMLIVAVGLTLNWFFDRRESATAWWAFGMWAGTAATAFLAMRAVAPLWLALGVGNALVAIAFASIATGFAVFAGKKPRYVPLFVGVVLWSVLYFGVADFREDIVSRIVVMTAIMACYSSAIVMSAWQGWKTERLPTFLATVVIYGLHAVMYSLRIPIVMYLPTSETGGVIHGTWVPFFAIEGFVLTVLSTFVFVALIKERAERRYRLAAEIDGLTYAATRRFFVSQARARLGRKQEQGVLAVIDLDHFKSINDTYGHMGGDRVLQAFGQHVQQRLEPGMIFGRLGGEEFGLYISGADDRRASEYLETLRASVEALSIPFMGSRVTITISIGAASTREAGVDFDHLMAAADSALYVAKEEGRNRLKIFTLAMRMHAIVQGGIEGRVGMAETRLSRAGVRGHLKRH